MVSVTALFSIVAVVLMPASLSAQSVQQLIDEGEFERAQQEAFLRDDARSLADRSRFALWAGDDEDARHFAHTAVEVASGTEDRLAAEVQLARVKWFFGERREAIERLRKLLQQSPGNLQVRYELGWRLIDDGSDQEAATVLEAVARRYNDGLVEGPAELVWAGRAMQAVDRPRDANRAFSAALREDEEHLEANLRLGQLMLDYHNTAEAEEAFEQVLEVYENHPEALVGMANIEFYRSGRFAASMELIDRAVKHYPGHPEVQRGRIEMLIAQGRWGDGQREATSFLDRSEQDAKALKLLAAAAYLRSDDDTYLEAVRRYDERRSNRPHLFSTVGEFAAMNNRHRASVRLFEKALDRDDQHAPALAGLGTALTRTGQEARGIEVLDRAFDADSFRVPVYNMLELYDRGLDDYITEPLENFRLRAHTEQYDLIRELTAPLVDDARDEFSDRYATELPDLTVEVFADSQSFSVRSVGLPHVDPHGICFGRVVLSRSPGEGNFNWKMVMWHELAHSYHLEASNEQVPVWFTEGLAEYETLRRDDTWTRFHDLGIARRVQHDRLWSLEELNRLFMAGRGMEVLHAYHLARLFIEFLDDTTGVDIVAELLEAFSETPEVEVVFEAVFEESMESLNTRFDDWLRQRYSGLLDQQLFDRARIEKMARDEEVAHPNEAQQNAYRAVIAAVEGNEDRARLQIRNATEHDEFDAASAVAVVIVYAELGDIEEGLKAGRAALDDGVESYDLRFRMSEMAASADRRTEAYVHALAATHLAPDEIEGWRRLRSAARGIDEEAMAARAAEEIFERFPHDASLARRRVGFFEESGDYHEAYRAARRWTEVAALDARAHEALGRTAAKVDEFDTAVGAYERAAMAAPQRAEEIYRRAAELFASVDADEHARSFRQRTEDAQ